MDMKLVACAPKRMHIFDRFMLTIERRRALLLHVFLLQLFGRVLLAASYCIIC